MTIRKLNFPKAALATVSPAIAIFLVLCFAAPRQASAADNMGLMYQQEFNRYIVYGDYTNSNLLFSEVEVLYYDRVIAVGYVKELRPSYIVVQVIKFDVNVFLKDATSIRPYAPQKLETLKKTVTLDTPYEYDPGRMTIFQYVTPPDAKVKKITRETYKQSAPKESAGKTEEPKFESRRHEQAAAQKSGEKEKLDSGPALKEKSDTTVKESEAGSRRRRRAETSANGK